MASRKKAFELLGSVKNQSQEKLARLSDYRTSTTDHSYLVYRTLFADLEIAAAQARGALLDIGCGNKPYEKMFKNRITSYTGCDVVQSSEERVDVICSATEIPLADATFDTVLCTQVIEHVADHLRLLKEAHRLLVPNGMLILSGPMYWPLHEEPHDYFRFTRYGFTHILQQAGFEQIEIRPNGGKWAVCGQVLIHALEETPLCNRLSIWVVNRMFAVLDDRFPNYTNTLNYVVTAKKTPAPLSD